MIFHNASKACLETLIGKTTIMRGTGESWLGLCNGEPELSGGNISSIELSGGGYQRIRLLNSNNNGLYHTNTWTDVTAGTVSNAVELVSKECTAGEGWTATHFVIFDQQVDGNPLVADILRDPDGETDPVTGLKPAKTLQVAKGQVAVFKVGDLQLTLK